MQVFQLTNVIQAKRTDVGDVFTDPGTWESWYGGALESVDPAWQQGAALKWKVGPPGTLLEVSPPEYVCINSGSMKTSWRFTEQGEQTLVEMEKDFRGGTIVVTNPAAQQRQSEEEINGLKQYVESRHKKWWQFWK
jgi:Polyketide cyclase / dehydrase and lipid transport